MQHAQRPYFSVLRRRRRNGAIANKSALRNRRPQQDSTWIYSCPRQSADCFLYGNCRHTQKALFATHAICILMMAVLLQICAGEHCGQCPGEAERLPSSNTGVSTKGNRDERHGAFIRISELLDADPETHIDEGSLRNEFRYSPATNMTLLRQALSKFDASIESAPSSAHEAAIQYCMELAQRTWISNQPVRVVVRFSPFSQINMLGTGQPSRNWNLNNTIYTMAMAKALLDKNLNAELSGDGNYDIVMTLNSNAKWYVQTDGRTAPNSFDLVTVCLHETFHGLLMSGGNLQVQYNQNISQYQARFLRPSIPGRFDSFMANQEGCNIQGYNDNMTAMGAVVTSNNLYFVSGNRQRIAKLHTPRPYVEGSSIYHLSELEYGAGQNGNDLMTPVINAAYSQHNVGTVVQHMASAMLDSGSSSGAPTCSRIGPPKIDDQAVIQGGPSDSGNAREITESDGGFTVQIGSVQVNGWVLVGAGLGCALITIVLLIAAATWKRPTRHVKRPARHITNTEDYIMPGTNSGGLV